MRKIILASASLRRKELLHSIGLEFKVVKSNVQEKLNPRLGPASQTEALSLQKAQAVAEEYADAIVIGADTLVVVGTEILGKPKDLEDTRRMLKKLSGKPQVVVTGFTVIDTQTKKSVTKSVETKIFMRKVTEKEINAYIEKENTLDKAGGYAVQGIGSVFIERIEGDYFNVVGLPLYTLSRELRKFGVYVL